MFLTGIPEIMNIYYNEYIYFVVIVRESYIYKIAGENECSKSYFLQNYRLSSQISVSANLIATIFQIDHSY